MKRRPHIILILIACLLMEACGRSSSSSAEPPVETTAEPPVFIGETVNSAADLKDAYPDYTGKIMISEVMPKNRTTSVDGRLDDWVELVNRSDESVLLDDWQLKSKTSFDLSGQ